MPHSLVLAAPYPWGVGVEEGARFGGLVLKGTSSPNLLKSRKSQRIGLKAVFVSEPDLFCYLSGGHTSLEADALERIVAQADSEVNSFSGLRV